MAGHTLLPRDIRPAPAQAPRLLASAMACSIAMLPAAYVGYTHVDEDLHHWRDIIAGCALGIGFSWYFVRPEQSPPMSIIPEISQHSWAVGFHMNY